MLRQGLRPDKLTYNTLILGAVKTGKLDSAMQFLEEMKVSRKYWKASLEPQNHAEPENMQFVIYISPFLSQDDACKYNCDDFHPDNVTYTTLLKVSNLTLFYL